jgi:hypothetical protein
MKISNGKSLLIAVLAVTATAQAGTKSRSSSIVIDSRTDLPELAQRRSEAMYLYTNGSGQAFLYLEQDQGKSLAILDVSNPGSIREVGRASLAVQSAYDFVQSLSHSAALIRYRDGSGFAVITFKKYKQPVLVAAPALPNLANIQAFGHNTLLFASANNPSSPSQDNQCEVIDVSNPAKLKSLVAIHGLKQRLERPDTGTLFLLGSDGLTVIRRPSIEEQYQYESTYTN